MIAENYLKIKSDIPSHVTLVTVSKLNSVERVNEAYQAGCRIFGENRVQELMPKYETMPKDIQWHLIGHLQSNKVKYIAPFIQMIHSVDSLKLMLEINKEAKKNQRIINILLQFHVAQEETKFGLSLDGAKELLRQAKDRSLENIRFSGIMGMATQTDDEKLIRSEFQILKKYFDILKHEFFSNELCFKEISMGMSHDYPIAIEEGSTIIRVGSKIFK